MTEFEKLFVLVREAHEANVKAATDHQEMRERHIQEIAKSQDHINNTYKRKQIIEETLRLVVYEGMPLTQANLVAKDKDSRGELRSLWIRNDK